MIVVGRRKNHLRHRYHPSAGAYGACFSTRVSCAHCNGSTGRSRKRDAAPDFDVAPQQEASQIAATSRKVQKKWALFR
jgi:hypothetical protein